jgi:type II secretory pathway component PulC
LLVGAISYSSTVVGMGALERSLEANMPAITVQGQAKTANVRRRRISKGEFQTILDTNMFKARRSVVKAPAGPANIFANGNQGPALEQAPPNLELTLNGTLIMGRVSFAMVADANGRNEKVYSLLDCLPADDSHPSKACNSSQGKLMAVKRASIEVLYQNQRFTVLITEKGPPSGGASRRNVARNQPARRAANRPGLKGGGAPFPITRNGNVLEVRVPQDEVAKAFENFSDVLKQARVVPFTGADGSGFQIRSIRPGSIFQRIGLHNFDVIKAVNGEPITTADQALRMMTMFRNEKEIVLDLQRRKESLKLNYIIE